ncbi:MAG: hypothetical protein CMI53_05675 [Parcubacteria group bacterium]|nr:hypothetical protein [Parcubacteria group bacterium]|tara:strand:- start:2222 stop:3127 length:906 start_codon:yes stop_codon:yes gene_type:complete
MLNFFTSIVLASLLLPTGFNFLVQKAVDYSFVVGTGTQVQAPTRIINKSFGLRTTAKSILVVDDYSGAILYNKNPSAALPIASITKLMTALTFLDYNADLDQVVKLKPEDRREGGIPYLLTGEEVTVRDLFYLMLVSSTNEAAVALADNFGMEQFISAMNKKAAELKMINSYFVDPSGLEPGNVASPFDLVKLANAVFQESDITATLATKEYQFTVLNTLREGKVTNNDALLRGFINADPYQIIGAKTGYLDEAGYTLLLRVKKDDISLTVVILGAETITDRWQEAKGLVDWVFRNYRWPE